MPRIAILRSTTPLRKTSAVGGVTKQRMNLDACVQLADKFDGVIVGSVAPDEVFEHISRHLPRNIRMKFRFYGRTFFMQHRGRGEGDDGRNAGWETILAENRIDFEPIITRVGKNRQREQAKFTWQNMEEFVTDRNAVFVDGAEGQLLFSPPTKFRE